MNNKIILFLMILSGSLQASDFNTYQFLVGRRGAGMAGAFAALSEGGEALWYNPAGLAGIQSRSLDLSANVYHYFHQNLEGAIRVQDNPSPVSLDFKKSAFSTAGVSFICTKPSIR